MKTSAYNYTQLAQNLGITTNDLKTLIDVHICTNNTIVLTEGKEAEARWEVQDREAKRISPEEALELAYPDAETVDEEEAGDD